MADFPFWLSDEQWTAISLHLPVNQPGPRRVSDRVILSGIIFVLTTGRPWRECPPQYGPYMTVFNRYNRWNNREIWRRIVIELENFGIELGSSTPASARKQRAPSPADDKTARKPLHTVHTNGAAQRDGASTARPLAVPIGEAVTCHERAGAHVTPALSDHDLRLLRQLKDCMVNYVSGLIELNHRLLTALETLEQNVANGRAPEAIASSSKQTAKTARLSARASL